MRMRPDEADQSPDQPARMRMPVLAVPVLAMIVVLVIMVPVLVVRVIVVIGVVSAHACQHARPGRAWSSGLVLAVDEYLSMAVVVEVVPDDRAFARSGAGHRVDPGSAEP